FPVYWMPHFGASAEANYPPRLLDYTTLNLTSLVLSSGRAPDESVKAAVLARLHEVRDDPRFFQYELGQGEMPLQGPDWRQRVEWLKQAIGWIREADPNHLINGPES